MSISLDPLKEASDWQAICSRLRREASCHLLVTDAWYQFLLFILFLVTSLGRAVSKYFKHQWSLRGCLTCLICYSVDIYAFRLKTKFSAWQCLLAYCFELIGKSPAYLYRSTSTFSVDLRHIKSETEVTATNNKPFSWTLENYIRCSISLYFLFAGSMCSNACSCCPSRLPGRWICRIFRPHCLCGPCLSCHPHICCASHCKGPCRIQGSSCSWLLCK